MGETDLTFKDWLDASEGFSSRRERARSDLGPDYARWLRAAWIGGMLQVKASACYKAGFNTLTEEHDALVDRMADAIADSAAEFGEWITWSTADDAAKAALKALIGNVKKEGRNE